MRAAAHQANNSSVLLPDHTVAVHGERQSKGKVSALLAPPAEYTEYTEYNRCRTGLVRVLPES